MSTRPNVEALRAELARHTGAEPPAGVERLALGVFLLAEDDAPHAARASLAAYAERVRCWLATNLAPKRFPAVLIHTSPRCPIVPEARLYADGLVNVVSLQRANSKADLVIHELTHAFSAIREEWSSELLAYYAGFSGVDGLSTEHERALGSYEIELDDIVCAALSSWSVLTPGNDVPGVRYDPTNPYSGFLFLRLFQELERRGGRARVFDYLRAIDAEPDKEAPLARLFQTNRQELTRDLGVTVALGRCEHETPDTLRATLRGALGDLERRWWADGFDIAYLRTAFSKWRSAVSVHAGLYLDYRMYRSQRLSGKENDVFRRHLLRRTRDALAKDAPSALLAYVRYFLLTDYALAEFRGQMTSLAAKDPDLLGALKRAVALLAQTPEDPLSQTARAHFHLFYPLALGAERAQGERILETLLHEDPTWEEAYLHLVASATASADALGRERWLEAYRKNAPSSHGPTLLERITHRDTDRRLG